MVAFPDTPIPWNDGITNQPTPAFLAYMKDLQARATAAEAAITALQTSVATIGQVFISSQNVTSSTSVVTFTGLDSTYDAYQFRITRFKPTVDLTGLGMQISVDGGVNWKAVSNSWVWLYSYIAGGDAAFGFTSTTGGSTFFSLSGGQAAAWNLSSEVMVYPSTAGVGLNEITFRTVVWNSATGPYQQIGSGVQESDSNPCNAVRFFFNGGNIASGRVTMYGMRKT